MILSRLAIVVAVVLVLGIGQAGFDGYARSQKRAAQDGLTQLQRIRAQLDKVRAAMDEANEAEEQAKKEIVQLRGKRKQYANETARLELQIAQTSQKMALLNSQIKKIDANLTYTAQQLADTKKRLATRESLFRARLQLMQTSDPITYLDVLLGAASFEDFLSRFESLQTIVAQDEQLIEAHQRDEQLIAQQKADIESQLVYVDGILDQTVRLRGELASKKSDRQVKIAALTQKEDRLEEVTEEQERELMRLADEQAKLLREKRAIEEKSKKKKRVMPTYSGGQLAWPLPGYGEISSGFGPRVHPITRQRHIHSGIDIPAPSGTEIVAAAAGEVILARWYGGYGNTIIIEHAEGFRTLYAHIITGGTRVQLGQFVRAGQAIAGVGSTGSSTGNHLHFGVYSNNEATDPLPYLQ
jgi:murein DD-endopeptidase MepM/ murein hydrolase activator NlpD